MLRVTTITNSGSSMLKLEGKLCGPWVDEVQQCWQEFAPGDRPEAIQVDLRDLSYLDGRGKDLLLRMEREGASLVGCSEFIRHLLWQERPDSNGPGAKLKEENHGNALQSRDR